MDQIGFDDAPLRLALFFGALALIGGWESLAARRRLTADKTRRWFSNLTLIALNNLALRLIFPITLVQFAFFCQSNGWGALNYYQDSIAPFVAVAISAVALDFAIYLQHLMFHATPALWRLHKTHHLDLDIDVTTGLRFHPIEIVLSYIVKFGVVAAIGAPPVGVAIFEAILNIMAMFNHGNINIPTALDRWIRFFVVTPDMHRVHHSIYPNETNSNFGFNLSVWDRLFGTYIDQPRDGHQGMTIGLKTIRAPEETITLSAILMTPFRAKKDTYSF